MRRPRGGARNEARIAVEVGGVTNKLVVISWERGKRRRGEERQVGRYWKISEKTS